MAGIEIAQAIIKGTSTAVKLITSIRAHIEEDKRAKKLARHAKRKARDINGIISEHRAAVDECTQLHSMMQICTKDMDNINSDLSTLCQQVSATVAPLRVVEAMSTGEILDRIVSRIEHLETRINNCCTSALTICHQKSDCESLKIKLEKMATLIQSTHVLDMTKGDLQVVEANGNAFNGLSHAKIQVNRTELVFGPTLKLSSKDKKILHDIGRFGSVTIAQSLVIAGSQLCFNYRCGRSKYEKGMQFLQLAATLGNPRAHSTMGKVRRNEKDYNGAAKHFLVAAQMGIMYDIYSFLLYFHWEEHLDPKLMRQAMNLIEQAAKNGDEEALQYYTLYKLTGRGTKQNREEAFRLALANEPSIGMWLIIGVCHFYGIGTQKSKSKAQAAFPEPMGRFRYKIHLYSAAVLKRNPFLLGYLRHFAELNDIAACEFYSSYLCDMAEYEDLSYAKEALKWSQKTADLGSKYFQLEYAMICERGIFCEESKSDAYKYYRLAARQGHIEAQLIVARLYIDGVGVGRDLKKAKYYLKLVKSLGDDYHYDRFYSEEKHFARKHIRFSPLLEDLEYPAKEAKKFLKLIE